MPSDFLLQLEKSAINNPNFTSYNGSYCLSIQPTFFFNSMQFPNATAIGS